MNGSAVAHTLAELEKLDLNNLPLHQIDALQHWLVYERGWLAICRDAVQQGFNRNRSDWLTAIDGPLGPDGCVRWALDLIIALDERDQAVYPRRRSYEQHAVAIAITADAALGLLAAPDHLGERLAHAAVQLRAVQWWPTVPLKPQLVPRGGAESTTREKQIATALYQLQCLHPDWALGTLRDLLLLLCDALPPHHWERTATVVVPLAAGNVGLLADLRVELAPGGTGQFYPHPAAMLFFEGDASFCAACATAWSVGIPTGYPPVDARWSLSLRRGPGYTRATAFDCFVVGGSHGAALAIALRHLIIEGPRNLDANRAITGAISPDGTLASISHYETKLAALLRSERRLSLIYPVIDRATLTALSGHENVHSQAVATIDEALQLMQVRHPAPPPPIDGLVRWSDQGLRVYPSPQNEVSAQVYAVERPVHLADCDRQVRAHGRAVIVGRPGAGKTVFAAIVASRISVERVFWHELNELPTLYHLLKQLAAFLAWRGLPRLAEAATQIRTGLDMVGADVVDALATCALEELRDQEVLLCIDDLDAETDGAVSRFLYELQALRPPALTIICTARERPTLLRADEEPIVLDGMQPDEAHALLALVDQDASKQSNMDMVIDAAERHPFYLRHAGLLLARDPATPASWAASLAADIKIEEHLCSRIDQRLHVDERRVLCVVALLGVDARAASTAAVQAVLGRDGVIEHLHQLSERQILRRERHGDQLGYRLYRVDQEFFAHHESLAAKDQHIYHERAGDFYEADDEPLLAAIHYDLAGQYRRVIDLVAVHLDEAPTQELTLALDRSQSRSWDLVVAGQTTRLTVLLEPYRAGKRDFQAAKRLRSLSDHQRIAVHLTLGQLYNLQGRSAEARDVLAVALDYINHGSTTVSAQRIAAFSYLELAHTWEHSDPDQALTMVDLGLQAAGVLRFPEVSALFFRRASILISRGDYNAAEAAIQQGLAGLPSQLGSERAGALLKLGAIASSRGDSSHAWRLYQQALHIYEATGDLSGGCGVLHNLGIEHELTGDWVGAQRLYTDALHMAERSQEAEDRTTVTLSLGILRAKQGHDDAQSLLRRAADLAAQYHLIEHLVAAQASLASLLADRGEWDALAPLIATSRELAEQQQIDSQLREIYSVTALLLLHDHDYEAAERVAQCAYDVACRECSHLSVGLALRGVGVVARVRGQFHHAHTVLSESVTLLDSDPYEVTRSKVQLALVALETGEIGVARPLLNEARITFSQLGATLDVAMVDVLLRSCVESMHGGCNRVNVSDAGF